MFPGANDSAKSAVSDAREAMRLIYELSKKVDESDPDVIKVRSAQLTPHVARDKLTLGTQQVASSK